MESLSINFEYCYGIKKLEHTFDFSNNKKTFCIYAPNGSMKTSFAKSFKDMSKTRYPQDLMHPNKNTVCILENENSQPIDEKSIFVIEPYDENYKSEKMSTLLANQDLRDQYNTIYLEIENKKDSFLKILKSLSGLKPETMEEEISKDITFDKNNFFRALLRLETEVSDGNPSEFDDIIYKEIFNDKVTTFLSNKEFETNISDYIRKYDELIDASTYFRKGIFNHTNATAVAKNLATNGFFKARHTVFLNADSIADKKEITTQQQLEEIIEEEKNTILNNPDLKQAFEKIDNALKNKQLQTFREYLIANMKVLPELNNLGRLKNKLWISYFKKNQDMYSELLDEYKKTKKALDEIKADAEEETTRWFEVINIFNKRFSVPFILKVDNQADVILNSTLPNIRFIFKDSDGEVDVEESKLLRVLSNGEKKALYILNIIFEVEARKKDQQETLFIFDDIADSFDYKNKYAIIQYLYEIAKEDHFYQIILTHNFDFFRTVSKRFFLDRSHACMIDKTDREIKIIQGQYLNNPLNYLTDNLHCNQTIFIASIPFARNFVEYSSGTSDRKYLQLTSLLHIKNDTENILISDLESIYNSIFNKSLNDVANQNNKVIDRIFACANAIAADHKLENKIVLSIAIRLCAEKFMIKKINDPAETDNVGENQTIKLIKKFKEKFPSDTQNIKLLEDVNLMTPENIHFNSFMYEPILDMSAEHLKNLYNDLSNAYNEIS